MKTVAALAGAPIALVLLLGAAMGAPAPSAFTGVPVAYPADLPPAPSVFAGTASGCIVPDPTGTGGCVTPAAAWMLGQIAEGFGPLPTSCWDAHAWNPASDHPSGKGCDVTFGRLGTFPGPDDIQRGWVLAEWLRSSAGALRVSYLIWQGLIWTTARADEGWRTYTGGGIYDPHDPTGGHYDHIHISTSI